MTNYGTYCVFQRPRKCSLFSLLCIQISSSDKYLMIISNWFRRMHTAKARVSCCCLHALDCRVVQCFDSRSCWRLLETALTGFVTRTYVLSSVNKSICSAMERDQNQHRLNTLNAKRLTAVLHIKKCKKASHSVVISFLDSLFHRLTATYWSAGVLQLLFTHVSALICITYPCLWVWIYFFTFRPVVHRNP